MARRSLKASILGIQKAKRAFQVREWTQEYLASEVGLETRQPIWKFFTGKPIERQNFMEICFQLGLDWQEIAELPTQNLPTQNKQDWNNCWDINTLVQVLRSRRSDKIQAQCATMRLLDVAQPIELEDIYVDVNILNNMTCQRWLDIFELQDFVQEFDRFGLGEVCQERVSAMQVVATYPKLMVLGKPGSGKTTFLQHIAQQCNQGNFLSDRVPIFIRLKNFAEDATETGDFSFLNYISQELADFGTCDQQIQTLLAHGRMLILLDGLDEVPEDDRAEIIKKICKLSEEYYKNQFIITCRIATYEYQFEGFTDVEIADFDLPQIEAFVQKWFVNVSRNDRENGKAKACQFMQKLQLSENQQIRELAVTPLLLNLACCVFQARSDFPARRVELYKQALNILLNRWDEARNIKRDRTGSYLSLPHKLKLLSQIAAITFKQERYFFTKSNVRQYIADYLRNLPTSLAELEGLQLSSQAVLKSLEAHGLLVERARGIYSFSHLTFAEYLTARNIVTSPEPEILQEKLLSLVNHLNEPRWHKVFLLTAGMLNDATDLLQLMKQHIDALVAFDKQLQEFLIWLNQKSLSVKAPYKKAAIRAFYLSLVRTEDLTLTYDLALSLAIDPRVADNLASDLAIDLVLSRALSLSLTLPCDSPLERVFALNFALPDEQTLVSNPELKRSLQQLKEQLPYRDQDRERLKEWCNTNGCLSWAKKLRFVMLSCCNIGHQWQFSEQQKKVLKQYYALNQLLVDCLKSGCEVTPLVREQILETLLLPVTRTSGYVLGNYGRAGVYHYG
ncbi:NACHT domain-containing NTPase [Brasilonema sp. UFV-L1]|uniref:NACHT domain-containing protein n=1 Tax=Brasilonema sp. UFV-L1 TaxID=2234130 RepID=UPI00145F8E7D|nr:NACHT domain-containing NTPase [Brasilonema sp. UFV-L1]NMG05384.1 histidine kinase [Brasilonema sp. UFV-L1]